MTATGRQRSGAILGLSMTEIMLLLVFVFLIVVAATAAQLESATDEMDEVKETLKQLGLDLNDLPENWSRLRISESNLRDYKQTVEGTLTQLGVSLDDLPDRWNRLVSIEALEVEHRKALDELKEKKREKQSLEAKVKEFEAQIADIRQKQPQDVEQLTEQLIKARKRIADLESEHKQVLDDLTEGNREQQDLEVKVIELEQQIATLKQMRSQDRRQLEKELIEARRNIDRQKQELEKINRKVADLKGKIGGVDKPPCWPDADGRPQFLLSMIMYDQGFKPERAWPDSRTSEAGELGLTEESLGRVRKFIANERYRQKFAPIYRKSVEDDCRHFVFVYDETTSKKDYKRQMKLIEGYFYKSER